MRANLLIKYIENYQDSADYDLGLLGESFSGLNSVFEDFFEISDIDGDLVVKTSSITTASIDVNNIIQIVTTLPFHNIPDLLNFLQVSNPTLFHDAQNFFNAFGNAHKGVNDYFRENQLDLSVLTALFTVFITKLFEGAGKQKNQITINIGSFTLPQKYANKLHRMVTAGKFKRALKPISENNVSALQIHSQGRYKHLAVVNDSNLSEYLPENEKILPELENGKIVNLTGEILALQSTKGEFLKFKVFDIEERFQLLTALPDDSKKTEDYKDYYKIPVLIKAEVYRSSLFKKPEIIIKSIGPLQQGLF